MVNYTHPVNGAYTLTQDFGGKKLKYGTADGSHMGRDYACIVGTPIVAPQDGVIVWSEFYPIDPPVHGYGNFVELLVDKKENNLYDLHLFGHLLRNEVESGQTVKRGQVIGLVDSTGRSTGHHLHWGVRLLEKSMDRLQTAYKYYLGNYYKITLADNGWFGWYNWWEDDMEREGDKVWEVDLRYGQDQSYLREKKWKLVHERYAKVRAGMAQIPYDDRIMKAFVYGYWDADFVYQVANFQTWATMTKPAYLKRLGKL